MMTLSTLLLVGCLAGSATAQDIVGVSWSGTTYSLNSTTGAGVTLGNTGYSQINNMAKSPAGKLYAASGYGVSVTIIEINPTTGVGTAVTTSTLTSVRGMAYLGSTLYVINDSSGTGIGLDDLYTMNVSTGAVTYVGSTGYYGVQGLASANGVLYGWEIGSGSGIGVGLITINTTTGVGTDVNPAIDSSGSSIQTLFANASGSLYGVQNTLYSINASTGAFSAVGSGGYSDLRGAEFMGGAPPSFTLVKSGSCPGATTLTTSNGTPGGVVALAYGLPGSFNIPVGGCAGTVLGLSGPTLAAFLNANGSGSASLSFNAPTGACGKSVQCLDLSTCDTSNVIVL